MVRSIDIAGHRLQLSNQDKVFYPESGITKGEVVSYYRRTAEVMTPHLRDRPLTLRRFPDGIDGEGWFQKEASGHFPGWIRVRPLARRGTPGDVRHVIGDDDATLVYLAEQATVEFHPWLSRVQRPEYPDLLVIDLDPSDRTELSRLRATARRTGELLDELGLTPYVQATGGRGYHVVAPLDAETDVDSVRTLARAAADHLTEDQPDRLTTAQRKEKRGNRIFLDTNRNGYAQTVVAPYSLRARPGATVATPLDWDELGRTQPNGHTLATMPQRLARKPDPWRDMHDHPGSAARARERLDALLRGD